VKTTKKNEGGTIEGWICTQQ